MLRFFRHFRQRLFLRRPEDYEGHALSGKVSRYLGYAVGEIVLIMIGIFLALQLNNWNDRRLDQIEEQEILARLLTEVQGHLDILPTRLTGIGKKQEALKRVVLVLNGQPIEDHKAFLADVAQGTTFPWGQPPHQRVTFEELQSSGKLGLLRNTPLRESIIKYYNGFANSEDRLREKVGKYSDVSFGLIPSSTRGATVAIDLELPESQYTSLAQSILDSDLHLHITREENRAKDLHSSWRSRQERGIELTAEIEAELAN